MIWRSLNAEADVRTTLVPPNSIPPNRAWPKIARVVTLPWPRSRVSWRPLGHRGYALRDAQTQAGTQLHSVQPQVVSPRNVLSGEGIRVESASLFMVVSKREIVITDVRRIRLRIGEWRVRLTGCARLNAAADYFGE